MKYNYNEEIKKLRIMKFKFNRLTIFLSNFFLSIIPKKIKSDKLINVKTIKIQLSNYKIKVYMFSPVNKSKASMIYFHGGGFYLKGAPYHYSLCKEYANDANINVFYVDYKLAPKYKYPTQILDGVEIYKYIVNHSNELNISNDLIGIGRDSAGANIALNVTKELEKQNLKLKYQMLIYPVIENIETESMKKYTNTPMWNSKLNEQMWKYYIGSIRNDSVFNCKLYAPTFIETCEYDPLHDEGIMYYEYLKKFNSDVYLNETFKTMHGYDILYKTILAKNSINKRIEFIKKYK